MADAYTTFNQVIIDTCHGIGDVTLRKYALLEKHARAWFTAYYNPESGQTLKTVLLDVGPDRVAELPHDYLDFVVVGKQYGDKIRTLGHNPRLSPLPAVEPFLDRCPLDAAPESSWPSYEYVGWEGGRLCGYGWGEYREEFTIDVTERVLRVSSLFDASQPLFFQYVAADTCPQKATPLHPAYALCLEYWMLWQMHLRKNELSPAGNYERLYHAAERQAERQLSPFSMQSLDNIIAAAYNQVR